MDVRVKICGITNLDDALVAAAAGADYLGFILWHGSKRAITVTATAHIVARLRDRPAPPTLVGVFVNATADEVAETMERCGLDMAQLSGDEPPSLVADPASPLYARSYKAIRPTSLAEAEAEAEWFLPPPEARQQPALLLDSYHPTLRGGTGAVADWSMAAVLAREVPALMLAGGLTPDNVASAARRVRPFAVDVASGVEATPGKKDHNLVRSFIANVRAG